MTTTALSVETKKKILLVLLLPISIGIVTLTPSFSMLFEHFYCVVAAA